MKTNYFFIVIAMVSLFAMTDHVVYAQKASHIIQADTNIKNKDKWDLLYQRIDSTREERMSKEELYLRYKLCLLLNDHCYVEKGYLKTNVTEKMLMDNGFPAYYLKKYQEALDLLNKTAADDGATEEERYEVFLKSNKQYKEDVRDKIVNLMKSLTVDEKSVIETIFKQYDKFEKQEK